MLLPQRRESGFRSRKGFWILGKPLGFGERLESHSGWEDQYPVRSVLVAVLGLSEALQAHQMPLPRDIIAEISDTSSTQNDAKPRNHPPQEPGLRLCSTSPPSHSVEPEARMLCLLGLFPSNQMLLG